MKTSLLSRLLLVFGLCVVMGTTRGQYVAIPDSNFGNWLDTAGYHSCMTGSAATGWHLDTTCSMVINATRIDIDNCCEACQCWPQMPITSLEGVQYFRNLTHLKCRNQQRLAYIPTLPPGLRYLNISEDSIFTLPNLSVVLDTLICYRNKIAVIASLPASLKYLDCSYDSLSVLPSLPASLTCLDVHYNRLTSLPTSLPASLQYFDCGNNYPLTTLPATLPATLTHFSCAGTYGITSMPALPSPLLFFDCSGTHITAIPALPASLTHLYCGGIQYLTSMPAIPSTVTYLNCFNSMYTQLPALPPHLDSLDCTWCGALTSLPSLPNSISYMACSSAPITTLPTLPTSLKYLDCSVCNLTSMPALPDSLQTLRCYGYGTHYMSIGTFPPLNRYLTYLWASQAGITNFTSLNDSLEYLDCGMNNLISLPSLGPKLNALLCNDNAISSIPALPASLQTLNCKNNQLTSLPPLPNKLSYINCAYNDISILPTMPEDIYYLDCHANRNISCLTYLGPYMYGLYIDSTNIRCLPNRFSISYYDIWPDTIPLCDASSGCTFFYNIAGNIHIDTAATCDQDSIYPGPLLRNMKIQLKQNNQVLQQVYTFTSGQYSFKTDSLTAYEVTVDTTGLPLHLACPQGGTRSVVLSPGDSVRGYEDFGFTCGATDFGVLSISTRLRAGFPRSVSIAAGSISRLLYGALCDTGIPGTVTTTFSGSLSYIGPDTGALTPSSVSGHTLTYTIADLAALRPGDLNIILAADTHAVIGSVACITTIISPSLPDSMPGDDTLTNCFIIRNSWDPNLKEIYPETITQNNDWLTYTIHFQNTGTDTAYLVVLKDTLSQYVNAASFQYLASSHHAVIQLDHNAMSFTFPHIDLVDSATNPPLSEGWIQYRVKANAALPNGTAINNTAYIYFDNNPAVVTNTATTNVSLTTCTDTTIYRSVSICAGDTFYFAGGAYATQDTFIDIFSRADGCDSIYVHYITLKPKPVVTLTQDSIVARGYLHVAGAWSCGDLDAFPLIGGDPAGGVYAGGGVHGDSVDLRSQQGRLDTISYIYTAANGCTGRAITSIRVFPCTGIQDMTDANLVSVYPNPNTGTFTLQTSNNKNSSYIITNMIGEVIAEKAITSDTQAIDMREAGAGVYTLTVKGSQPVRFVVVR